MEGPVELTKYYQVQKIAKEVLDEIPDYITPLSTERDIAEKATELMANKGIVDTWYYSVPAFVLLGSRSCLSISGKDYIPSTERVGMENLVTIDLSPCADGIWGDCARSFAIENGLVLKNPKNSKFADGIEMERHLHEKMRSFVTPEATFCQLFEYGNALISQHGWENLDFNGNLGHSIEKNPDDRRYIDRECNIELGSVALFTFEPHIKKQGGVWGFKHENIYYFDTNRKINEL